LLQPVTSSPSHSGVISYVAHASVKVISICLANFLADSQRLKQPLTCW